MSMVRWVLFMVAFLWLVNKSLSGHLRGKCKVLCPEDDCDQVAKGYDIEACWDEDDTPIWAVSYECSEGHRFIAEYERELISEEATTGEVTDAA